MKVNQEITIEQLAAFCVLMENGKGILSKSPDYIREKFCSCLSSSERWILRGSMDMGNQNKFNEWLISWSVGNISEERKPMKEVEKEAIDRMAEVISDTITKYGYSTDCAKLAEAILALHYPCKGLILYPDHDENCPACKGTREGEKMFAILDEKQEVPENPFVDEYSRAEKASETGSVFAMMDYGDDIDAQIETARFNAVEKYRGLLLSQGWRKTKEVK